MFCFRRILVASASAIALMAFAATATFSIVTAALSAMASTTMATTAASTAVDVLSVKTLCEFFLSSLAY